MKYGNWLHRVPIDTVIPELVEAEHVEDGFFEPVQEAEEDRFRKEHLLQIRNKTDNVEVIEDEDCEKEEPKSEEGKVKKKRLERRKT